MNGIHDMGGMHGMGPIQHDPDEPVFRERWESRVFALFLSLGRWGRGRNWRHFRYELEVIPPAEYLHMSYYERWLTMIVSRLTESDLVTEGELASGWADPNRPRPEVLPTEPQPAGDPDAPAEPVTRRFDVGEPVRARNMHPVGHTRIPRYVRGRVGTIERVHGTFRLQDTDPEGFFPDDRPLLHVYTVHFTARELWGEDAPPRDAVYVDLWEAYLEPA